MTNVIRRGVAGQQLLQFADSIDKADLQLMSQAIEEGCEQVELNVTQSLGVIDTVRFSQQNDLGWGDYTKERTQWLGNPSLNEIAAEIKTMRKNWPQHK